MGPELRCRPLILGLAVVMGFAGLVTTAATVAAPVAQAATPQRQVSGWITYYQLANGTADAALNPDLFSDVSEFWFHAVSATSIVPSGTTPDAQLTSSVASIRSHDVPVTITVTDGTGGGVMADILSNPTTRLQQEQALIAVAVRYHASGIDLDYENMAFFANGNPSLVAPTRAGFDAMVQELSGALHARGMILAVDVITKLSEPGGSPAQQVYDYPTIGRYADRVRIMTYDEHAQGTGYPGGPVSGISWVDPILAFATSVIPPAKLYMGVPLYGYDWSSKTNRGTAVSFTQASNLMAQYHATRQWSIPDGSPFFTYTDASGARHTVWYDDAESLQARLPLVGKYGLGGIAMWSFGNEDPAIWGVLRAATYGPNPFGSVGSAVLWPGGVRVTGWSIDPNSTAPINVDLYADGKFLTRTLAGVDRPDVGNIYFAYGTTHGFDTTVDLPAGQHQICAYGINVGTGTTNPKLGCIGATVPTNNPTGHLETASGKAGVLTVTGWTLDPDTAAPLLVDVYVDGKLTGETIANVSRPDVATAYPGWGAAHGFSTSVDVSGGTHQVCAFAINQRLGTTNPSLGCSTVKVSSGSPVGDLESAQPSSGAVTVTGWTIDPNTASPIGVAVYVNGKLASDGVADISRPDVAADYPPFGPEHGYSLTVDAPAGKDQVCVYGLNTGPGDGNPELGCTTVTVPSGNPIGHLESVVGAKGGFTASGWALDPNTASSIEVALYVDGAFALQQTASVSRPDIAADYPPFGAAHGFALPVTVKAGKHTVCAFGINVGRGDTNTSLGCEAVNTS
ncbi:MAG TPA: glycosyl hydrolase family 18 protein [Acidothermaceae bacterium]